MAAEATAPFGGHARAARGRQAEAAAMAADAQGWAERAPAGLGPAPDGTTERTTMTAPISHLASSPSGMAGASAAPRRKSFAEALYRALHRHDPTRRPQILRVFKFLKQNSVSMTHEQVQPTLVAALGLELVRTAWLEARREVEAAGQDAPNSGPPLPLPQEQAQGQQERLAPAASAPARARPASERWSEEDEDRRVRPRLARQDTVMWRAGEGMPLQRMTGGGCPHTPPEPRPDEHHPRCPFYAPRRMAGAEGMQNMHMLQQDQQEEEEEEEEEKEEGIDDASSEEEAGEGEGEAYEEEEWEGEEDEDDLESLGSAVTSLSFPGGTVRPVAAPVMLLLAKDVPELEDEEYLQEGVPEGLICPISLRILVDPVVAQDGYTYQRAALERWIARCNQEGRYPRSPMTNLPMAPWYIPSYTMRSMVDQFIERKRSQRGQQQPAAVMEGAN